jgi:hypothetical protein
MSNSTIKDSVISLAEKAANQEDSGRAMHYSQAALNLAHAEALLCGIKKVE